VTFADPYLLLTLLAVPLAAAGYVWLDRRRASRSGPWSARAMLPNIVRRPPRGLRRTPVALFLIGLTFLLVGFARPQRVLDTVHGGAPTVVLTFDVSGSMGATDVGTTRIAAAHKLAVDFLHELPLTYRVAVVDFANGVHVLVGPTLDRKLALAKLPKKAISYGGTSLGDGLDSAIAVAATAAGQSSVGGAIPGAVVLFSDGGQNAGGTSPGDAAVSALVDGIPISTVAVGTRKAFVVQSVKFNGEVIPNQIPVPVQTATMETLAKETHGQYFSATAAAEKPASLASIYAPLRSSSIPGHKTDELAVFTVIAALVCILAGIALSGLWFGRVA
jgi:Ca-activated chloride channel homolog